MSAGAGSCLGIAHGREPVQGSGTGGVVHGGLSCGPDIMARPDSPQVLRVLSALVDRDSRQAFTLEFAKASERPSSPGVRSMMRYYRPSIGT